MAITLQMGRSPILGVAALVGNLVTARPRVAETSQDNDSLERSERPSSPRYSKCVAHRS